MSGSIVMPMDATGYFARQRAQINNADYVDPANQLFIRVYRLLAMAPGKSMPPSRWNGGAVRGRRNRRTEPASVV
jgi:hypothetical protein